jgi:hypothetical protein
MDKLALVNETKARHNKAFRVIPAYFGIDSLLSSFYADKKIYYRRNASALRQARTIES